MKIEISGIILSSTTSWARYWILKAFQDVIPCDEIQLQTCPISLEVIGDSEWREVRARGVCNGIKFTGKCTLHSPQSTGKFYLSTINMMVFGKESRMFHELNLPGYPLGDTKIITEKSQNPISD